MSIKINIENLCLPVSQELATLITDHDNNQAITINFRDPSYIADACGFHPVEIRLEQAYDIYSVWEQNFQSYCTSIRPFKIETSAEG